MSVRDLDQDTTSGPETVRTGTSPWQHAVVRVVRAMLAIYLLPVIALVLIVGGLAAVVQKVAQTLVGPTAASRQPTRYRHAPHLGMPAVRTWLRSAR